MLAEVLGILTDLRCAPAVDRNVKGCPSRQAWNKASHDWKARRSMSMRDLEISNDMAGNLELLQGYFHGLIGAGRAGSIRGKDEYVPVFVPHFSGNA